MTVTPEFDIERNGYDKRQVDLYVDKLRDEYQALYGVHQRLQARTVELERLRAEQEDILQVMLAAQELAKTIEAEAKVRAEQTLREAMARAEATLQEAQMGAEQTLQEAKVQAEHELREAQSVAEQTIDLAQSAVSRIVEEAERDAQKLVADADPNEPVEEETHDRNPDPPREDTGGNRPGVPGGYQAWSETYLEHKG